MANSSKGNPTRSIIIPRGVLNPNQVNIINIPQQFNSTAPLLVTPRKDGGGLKSQSLPVWKDELAISNCENPKRNICTYKGNKSLSLSNFYNAVAMGDNRPQNPNETFDSGNWDPNVEAECICVGNEGSFYQPEYSGAQQSRQSEMISSAGEQYTSSFEHPSHFGNEPYQSPPTHSQTHPPMGKPVWKLDQRSVDERLYYPERYETPPQVEQTSGDTSGAPAAFYRTCGQIPSPYSPKVVHMSSKSFAQVDDNPPESYSMTVDAPGGIDEQGLRYATQMVTFGDTSGPGSRRPFQPTFMSTPVTGDPYSSSMQEPSSDWYENFEEPPDSGPYSAAFFPSRDPSNGYNQPAQELGFGMKRAQGMDALNKFSGEDGFRSRDSRPASSQGYGCFPLSDSSGGQGYGFGMRRVQGMNALNDPSGGEGIPSSGSSGGYNQPAYNQAYGFKMSRAQGVSALNDMNGGGGSPCSDVSGGYNQPGSSQGYGFDMRRAQGMSALNDLSGRGGIPPCDSSGGYNQPACSQGYGFKMRRAQGMSGLNDLSRRGSSQSSDPYGCYNQPASSQGYGFKMRRAQGMNALNDLSRRSSLQTSDPYGGYNQPASSQGVGFGMRRVHGMDALNDLGEEECIVNCFSPCSANRTV